MSDCIVAMLLAAGITLGIILIAALITALVIFTGGTGEAFVAIFAGVLADWWIPIAVSVLLALALAYDSCTNSQQAAPGVVQGGAAIGLSAAFALVVVDFRWRRRLRITRTP